MAGYRPGESRNRGRPPGTTARRVLLWDFKAAVREQCPRALERVVECLDDPDKKVRLAAAELLLAYGHGKPQVAVELNATHAFVIAPEVMPLGQWLANKGQPTPNGWLEHQKRTQEAGRASEAATSGAGHPAEGPTIDAVAEPEADPLLLAEDPTAPPEPGTRLN